MTQTDLIRLIANDSNLRYDAVRKVLRKLTKYVSVALDQGELVRFGLGSFHLKERPPKPVQDFKTNTRYMMGPSTQVIYSPSQYIRTSVKKADAKIQAAYEEELAKVKNNGK